MEKIIHSLMKQGKQECMNLWFLKKTTAETHWKSVLKTDENLLLSG